MRILKIIRQVWRIIKLNIKELILFELVYHIVFAVCGISLSIRFFSFALKKAGYSYLAVNNILAFVSQPWSIVIISLLFLLCAVSVFFEVCTLLAAFQASERGEKLKMNQLLQRGIKKLWQVVLDKNIRCIFLTLFFILASGIFYFYLAAERMKPIKDLIKSLNTMPKVLYGLQIGFVILVFCMLSCLFELPFVILDRKDKKSAEDYSKLFWKRHRVFISVSCFLLCFAVYGAAKLILYLATLASAWVIGTFVDKSIQLAVVLTVFEWLQLFVMALGNIVSSILFIAHMMAMYYQYRQEFCMESEQVISFEEEKYQLEVNRRTSKILGIVLFVIIAVFFYDVISNGIYYAGKVLQETSITAHRGSSVDAPENTIAAFKLAIEQMADYIELDVQETKDGEVIVMHDKSFKRTTGVSLNTWNLNYNSVLRLDAGSYMGEEFAGEKVPTLAEVFELCDGVIMLNIELKNNGHNDTLVEKVVALIEQYDFENQCVLTSTSLKFLKQVKEQNSNLKTGYILSTAYGSFYENDDVDFFSVSSGLLNEQVVKSIHESGHEVHAWTVNSKAELERMKLLGVDNVITDYPVLAREILYRQENTEGIMEYVQLMLDR